MNILLKDINQYRIVDDILFNYQCNSRLLSQVLNAYIHNSKTGIKAFKNRALVNGSNKKLWAQKGTGRARVGSGKAPHFRSGGAAFIPKKKCVLKKINKKMYHLALRSILSDFYLNKKIIFIKHFNISSTKTKSLLNKIKFFTKDKKVLFLLGNYNSKLDLALRNLSFINVNYFPNLNILNILRSNILIIDEIMLQNFYRVFIYEK